LHQEALVLDQPPYPFRSTSLNNLAGSLLTRAAHRTVLRLRPHNSRGIRAN
jgi:hypothetical protein